MQRYFTGLSGLHWKILLPLGKNSVARGAQIVIVRAQFRDCKVAVRVCMHRMRFISGRTLICNRSVWYRLVVWPDDHAGNHIARPRFPRFWRAILTRPGGL